MTDYLSWRLCIVGNRLQSVSRKLNYRLGFFLKQLIDLSKSVPPTSLISTYLYLLFNIASVHNRKQNRNNMTDQGAKSRRKNTYLGKNMYQYVVDDNVTYGSPMITPSTSSRGTMPGKPPPNPNYFFPKPASDKSPDRSRSPTHINQSSHTPNNRPELTNRKHKSTNSGSFYLPLPQKAKNISSAPQSTHGQEKYAK